MPCKQVYIIGGGPDYALMFKRKGWEITPDLKQADLLQFTGGSDVSPSFYGEEKHPLTNFNLIRDRRERIIFNVALKNKIPMAGICRGGQFLNVMNGGRIWQHIDNHAKSHKVIDIDTGESFVATSTHHQMMNPHKSGKILAIANVSSKREKIGKAGQILSLVTTPKWRNDIEAVFYLKSKSLCFQPHPEFLGFDKLSNRYFGYIEKHLHLV